jgi:hypothetical protein
VLRGLAGRNRAEIRGARLRLGRVCVDAAVALIVGVEGDAEQPAFIKRSRPERAQCHQETRGVQERALGSGIQIDIPYGSVLVGHKQAIPYARRGRSPIRCGQLVGDRLELDVHVAHLDRRERIAERAGHDLATDFAARMRARMDVHVIQAGQDIRLLGVGQRGRAHDRAAQRQCDLHARILALDGRSVEVRGGLCGRKAAEGDVPTEEVRVGVQGRGPVAGGHRVHRRYFLVTVERHSETDDLGVKRGCG